MNGDWLDGLARRTTRSPGAAVIADEDGGTRVSRGAALKLGVASVATLSTSLTLVPSAAAADEIACLDACYDKYQRAAQRALLTCDDFYGGNRLYNHNGGWREFQQAVKDGPWSFVQSAVREVARRACINHANNAFTRGLDRCDAACRETCSEDTRARASALGGSVCRGTEPPRRSENPPPPPPAPNAGTDPCAACEAVGGICCGPAPPGGAPCGCAGYKPPDGTPCGRVGC